MASHVRQLDLARATGFSPATVSRVLRNDPRIGDATRRQVLSAAAELGYIARPAGHDASSGRNLGLLIANPDAHPRADYFFGEVLHGVTEEAERLGHTVSTVAFDGLELPRLAREPRVDGLIVGGIPIRPEFVELVRSLTVPCVFIGRYLGHVHLNAVLTDNLAGGELAAAHLARLGRKRIAFIGGDPVDAVYADRLEGYRRAIRAFNLPELARFAAHSIEGGQELTARLLDERPDLDALFVADDLMAIGALRALAALGRRVPDDVAVVGYSDLHLAALSDPPLTTVHVARRRLGQCATRLLSDLLAGNLEAPMHLTVPPRLIIRSSCGAPSGATLPQEPEGFALVVPGRLTATR